MGLKKFLLSEEIVEIEMIVFIDGFLNVVLGDGGIIAVPQRHNNTPPITKKKKPTHYCKVPICAISGPRVS